MDTVDAALMALNAAASKSRTKDKKLLMESAGQASTHLVLLKLSSISEQVAEKLCNFLRTSFVTLYARLTVPTLGLVSAIFETVYHERILPAMGSGQEEQKGRWESVLHALLGGVLDFLDDNHTTETKDAIGDMLFSILADICFSLSAPRTSVDFRCMGYNILIDSAASHQENQQRLRDPKILGGERLGSCIWRTKDYLALEALLNLFARVLPSTNGSASGRAQRTAFVQSVFLRTAPSESTTTGKEIADLLERVSSSDWDEMSLKIVDAMSRSSIIYPQAFEVNEVVVSGTIYPSDRLYADDKTFLINVVLEDDQYESLEVSYTAVSKIRLSQSSAGRIHIILSLSSPPRLGKNFLEISTGAVVGFSLCIEDEGRLLQAFKSRGLAQMITTESPMIQKLSVAKEPTKLEIDSTGRLVTEPTQNERIENLSQFYRTDEKSDDILSAGDSEAFCPIEITSSSVGPRNVIVPHSDHREESTKHGYSEPSASSTKVPSGSGAAPNLTSTDSKYLFDAAFGTSDDDLSEFTDEETPLPRSKIFRRASTSISIPGRISFGPASGKAVLPQAGLARGRIGKVVLDSDDGAPPAPALKLSRNAKKALICAPTTNTAVTEDRPAPSPGPRATITSDVSTPGPEAEAKVLVPATTSGRRSTAGKVLRFSDLHIPAPDFNAAVSSPPTVPTSVLKSALVKKPLKPQSFTLQGSSPCLSTAAVAAKSALSEMPVASRAKDVLDDLVPPSSSPTPAAKKTVKSNLRKKDQLIADAAPVQPVKRKAAVVVDSDDDVPLASRKDVASRPAKRARANPSDRSVPPKANSAPKPKASSPKKPSDNNSPALRPPMPPCRRYHARKGRASSPRASVGDSSGPASGPGAVPKGNFVDVDYDELPTNPPRRSAAAGAVKRSVSPAAKTKKEPLKPAAKTKHVIEGETVEQVEKTLKKAGDKKTEDSGHENTVTVEKASKVKKTEKTAKVTANKASPENAKRPVKCEKSEIEWMAQKNKTMSKMPTTTKTQTREPESSTDTDKVADAFGPEGDAAVKAAPRVPPRPHRAGASAKKAKEENCIQPVVANTLEPELVTTSPALERTNVRTDARDTRHAADTLDTADIAIARDEATSSDIELAFVKDVDPPKLEMVFSDPSTVNNFSEAARPSSSKSAASKAKAVKARSLTPPWDAMAQRIQSEQPAPDARPLSGLVMSSAEDRVTAPALDAGNSSTGTNTISARNSLTTLVGVGAGKRETAVQTTATTMSPALQDEVKPVVIDLTLDTPPKPVPKASRPEAPPVAPLNANVDTAALVGTEDALGRQEQAAKELLPQPVQHSHAIRFMSPREPPSVHARYRQERSGRRLQPYLVPEGDRGEFVEAGDETLVDIDCGSGNPGLDAIVDVLNKLHQVVIESIANKFEGVRQEARAGRDELLRYAAADLHTLHAQSVTHFNRLVDLEAEYATIGRNVLHANEDWVNVNQQVCDTVAVAVEKHDRGTLSKRMPATLVTFKF